MKKITPNLEKIKNPALLKKKPSSKTKKAFFPIVGIGASAGGLEALELFLVNVTEESNIAFVIVQHLDPTHKGVMVELLQRHTKMTVVQAKDSTIVKPKCVYIIPPNKDMSILYGVLHLLDPVEPRGLRLPIDFFFRSLADDQKERSIGVILSGMGSDGTLGLRAIKEKAGIVFVQDPATAKFEGMPQSAIDADLADVVAPVEELPQKILAYNRNSPRFAKIGFELEGKTQSSLDKILILLRTQTGHDFSLYKNSTIYRRIERRMGIHQIDKIADYVHFLQTNKAEIDLLFKELLIGVTNFFRDSSMWEYLKEKVVPNMVANTSKNKTFRAWVPSCSTGEEAYSLAIIFKEVIENLNITGNFSLNIFATDLDKDAIEKARQGMYPLNISADVSPERLNRFFVKRANGYEISKTIREMVIFAPQNLIMDPPFTKLDILSCRNLLIYLTSELQKKLIPLFHYTLNPGGILFLGSAETIGSFTNHFKLVDNKSRIYKRLETSTRFETIDFPSVYSYIPSEEKKPKQMNQIANIQSLADGVLLQKYSPAAVLVNNNGDIIYISGRTGKYLEPAAGKANWNIFAMARPGLQYELSNAFQRAVRTNLAVTVNNILVGTNGGSQAIDLHIQPLQEPAPLSGLKMIIFKDIITPFEINVKSKPTGSNSNKRVFELVTEVERLRNEIQVITEEMQSSQEELKSTNEELQSSNEELQSTNEELTTSKEEMQSMNEELQTINNELQSKFDELTIINNDMKNLLDSTEIATLFLDDLLRIRRFTNRTSEITKLIPNDVGRPITDIASELFYQNIGDDVKEVLRSLVKIEKEICTSDGKWYQLRMHPYRTFKNMIDGVVITYSDITIAKKLEKELVNAKSELESKLSIEKTKLNKAEDDLRTKK